MAHRGDSANIPENTFQAYKDAFDLNVDVIETDLRITKDNEFIFFHDARVNRTTNGNGFVRSFTLNELKKLDQGYRFRTEETPKGKYLFRDMGFKIQSLEEILTKFPKMKFNMDIKDRIPSAPKILAEKLNVLDADHRVMIGSFHHKQLERFRLLSGAPTSASPIEVWNFRQKVIKWLKQNPTFNFESEIKLEQEEIMGDALPYFALQIPERFAFIKILAGKKFVTICHMLDIAVHIWTVNDPGDMFRLLDWGIDGIFSDDPKMLLDIVEFKFRKK